MLSRVTFCGCVLQPWAQPSRPAKNAWDWSSASWMCENSGLKSQRSALWETDGCIELQPPTSPHLTKLLGWEEDALEESVRRFFPCDAPWEETETASCLHTKPSAWMNYYHSFTWVITALSPLPCTHPVCVFVCAPACPPPRDTLSDLSTTGSLQILFPDRFFTQPPSRFVAWSFSSKWILILKSCINTVCSQCNWLPSVEIS